MLDTREFASLGHFNHGWLNARHHFSFGEYHAPERMRWGKLRVWNDDIIAPKSGFAMHPHSNMEIISFVQQGAITHKDSLGNTGRTAAGNVQVMSAGTGIRHSEYNLEDEETHLFQIWIEPREPGGKPRWDAKAFTQNDHTDGLNILASGYHHDIAAGALEIRADARVYGAQLQAGEQIDYSLPANMCAYLVPATGDIKVDGTPVHARDGIAIAETDHIAITAITESRIILVETQQL